MPTPRQHGGAGLVHYPMNVPGVRGLSTEQDGELLSVEWATKLENTVLDASNRVRARKGWQNQTSSAFSAKFISGTEYRKADGTVQLVGVTATKVAKSTDSGSTWSDVTGTAVFTSGNWHLTNFNGYTLGFQSGKAILQYDGTTSSLVADVNCPTGGVGTAAFGRAWGVASDGVTLKYSVLLNHTDFTNAGSGTFNLANVWPDSDSVAAIAAYNNALVIFGKRNILIMTDGTGSTIGLNPTNARISDTIPGIGCLTQHSVQLVNGDLWFVSNSKTLVSLKRILLGQRSGELDVLSKNVNTQLKEALASTSFDLTRLRTTFSPANRFYLLSLPQESSVGSADEVGKCYCFDTATMLEDGSARCIGIWNQMVPTVFMNRADGSLLSTLVTVTGKVGLYNNYQDNSTSYRMVYESGWLDILSQSGYEIILKRVAGYFLFESNPSGFIKWLFDYGSIWNTRTISFASTGSTYEWGIAEWGLAEWGSGVSFGIKRVAGAKQGKYIKIGVEAVISGGSFAIQQLDLFSKVGRLVG